MDIRSTYHPDGSLASSLTQFYDRDRIRSVHYLEYDLHGGQTLDSTYYQDASGLEQAQVHKTELQYDEQGNTIVSHTRTRVDDQEWFDNDYTRYYYNQAGCLTEVYYGSNPQWLTTHYLYQYNPDCQIKSLLCERYDGASFQWVPFNRQQYTYNSFPDSSREVSLEEEWDEVQSAWSFLQRKTKVYDLQNHLIRDETFSKGGRIHQNLSRYDADGTQWYFQTTIRRNHSAQWVPVYEYELIEKSGFAERFHRRIGFDTTRQGFYLYSNMYEEHDAQDRLVETIRIDSVWNQDHYQIIDDIWQNEYTDFCDGMTQTRISKRGGIGLSPQPVNRTDYGYLHQADCQLESETVNMFLSPNPAHERLTVESEALLAPGLTIEIVDHLGRRHFVHQHSQRQLRMEIPIQQLKAGAYILRLVGPTASQSQTFIKY
ncbi:MAG: T9SS type A sorting domain-containing protein [Bacteroidota bacterium]